MPQTVLLRRNATDGFGCYSALRVVSALFLRWSWTGSGSAVPVLFGVVKVPWVIDDELSKLLRVAARDHSSVDRCH
jgi:hypothetical protein